MNRTLSRFFKQFNAKHIVKHTLLTTGLTMVGGPWGLAMGITYCIGDTVGDMKKFSNRDAVEFWCNLSQEDRTRLFVLVNKKDRG
jgi:hypothetical protein